MMVVIIRLNPSSTVHKSDFSGKYQSFFGIQEKEPYMQGKKVHEKLMVRSDTCFHSLVCG